MDAAEEAMDKEFHGSYDIWGGDIDPHAVEIARAQRRQGRGGGRACVLTWPTPWTSAREGQYGRLVTNPPYGERLLEKQEAGALYRQFGQVVRRMPPDWRVQHSLQPHRI